MKKHSGFTLLELMITLAIIGLVMAFAVPSMSTFIKNDRLSSQINNLVGHLAYARSEAVLRSQQVGLCASDDTTSCTATNWADGWILYVDLDSSSTFNTDDIILRVQQALSGNNTLTSTMGNNFIYDNRGFSSNGAVGTFSLCDDRLLDHVKSISISNTGRVRQVLSSESPTF